MKRNRRHVRCTMCTKYTWLGNASGRYRAKEELKAKLDRREIRQERRVRSRLS